MVGGIKGGSEWPGPSVRRAFTLHAPFLLLVSQFQKSRLAAAGSAVGRASAPTTSPSPPTPRRRQQSRARPSQASRAVKARRREGGRGDWHSARRRARMGPVVWYVRRLVGHISAILPYHLHTYMHTYTHDALTHARTYARTHAPPMSVPPAATLASYSPAASTAGGSGAVSTPRSVATSTARARARRASEATEDGVRGCV
jgi:hypothetical protein